MNRMIKEKYCRTIISIALFLLCMPGFSQDKIPVKALADFSLKRLLPITPILDREKLQVELPVFKMPPECKGVGDNVLSDSLGVMNSFYRKMERVRSGADDTITVLHIGDSHIRGHIFPQTAGKILKESFGAVKYIDLGINGATTLSFANEQKMDEIRNINPDLLIISFGTNESHNRGYNPIAHYKRMDDLIYMIRRTVPAVPIIMTTPPGSYDRFRIRRRRYSYRVNPRTSIAVDNILKYADHNGIAVWDMYNIMGGKKFACLNWINSKLMRNDRVHFFAPGYVLQGEMLGRAIIKAYNNYVRNR